MQAPDAGAISQKVGAGEKIACFFANIGNIPLMALLSTFFLIFYADVIGLNAGALAALFLISKIVGGLSGPVTGFLLDKFPVTKTGKFRPMLMLGTIICSVNYILLWLGPVWSPVGKRVIVCITCLLLGLTFDIMDISLNSLLPVMTTDNKERDQLSLIKSFGYMAGAMGLSVLGPIIVASGTLKSYCALIFGAMVLALAGFIGGALLVGLGGGLIGPPQHGIQAGNTLYAQYKTGKRAEAAIASLSSFITKVARGVAGYKVTAADVDMMAKEIAAREGKA